MSHVSSAIAKQARRSVTAGIHMPSAEVFALADKLVLIADGRMVYSGPQLGAVEFFSADPYGGACLPRENPADFCVSVVLVGGDRAPSIEKPAGAKGPTAQKLAEVFAATPLAAEGLEAVSTAMAQPPGSFPAFAPTHVDRVRQFYTLSERSLTQFARSSSIWRTSLFKMGWIGFLYSTTYAAQPLTEDGYINIATCFYFSLMFGILGNLRGIATLFDERSLYYHERTMRAYEPIVYFFVTTFSPMPWLIFMNCLFSTVVFWTIGLWKLENAFGVYLWYLMVTTLTNLIGFAWAQMLAAYTSSQQVAMSVWQPGVYIWSQTSDFPIQMPTINHDNPAWFLMSVSFTRWAYEAIILAVFWNGWGPVTQNTIFKKYGFTNTPLWAPLPFMFLFPLLVRLVTYFPLLEKPSKLETLEKNEYTGAVDAAIAAGGTTDSVAVAMGTDDDMQKMGDGDDQGGFASAEKLTINAQGVYYSVRLVNEKGVSFIKPLLRNVTCEIKPGELCAVMGPSGAGKSTFLDWLAGRKTTGFGKASIQYNGVTPTFAQRSSCEAYVMQHDVMINTLTVNETLRIACMLRLNRPDSAAVTARVRYVLSLLSLEASAHMLVAALSTGQRRLASVAVEIIHLPSIVYLDEPTSGLDSGMSLDFIKAVQRLTAAGRTVVCTIHQPTEEIFGMFTKLLLIGDGMARYFGTPDAAIETLYGEGATAGGRNPAEMLMDYVKRAPPPEDGGLLEAEPTAAGAFDYDASMTRGGDESFSQMLSKFNPIEELRNEGYHFYVHLLRNVLITKNTKNQQVIATIRNIVVALWYVIATVDSTWRGSYMTRGYFVVRYSSARGVVVTSRRELFPPDDRDAPHCHLSTRILAGMASSTTARRCRTRSPRSSTSRSSSSPCPTSRPSLRCSPSARSSTASARPATTPRLRTCSHAARPTRRCRSCSRSSTRSSSTRWSACAAASSPSTSSSSTSSSSASRSRATPSRTSSRPSRPTSRARSTSTRPSSSSSCSSAATRSPSTRRRGAGAGRPRSRSRAGRSSRSCSTSSPAKTTTMEPAGSTGSITGASAIAPSGARALPRLCPLSGAAAHLFVAARCCRRRRRRLVVARRSIARVRRRCLTRSRDSSRPPRLHPPPPHPALSLRGTRTPCSFSA